MEWIVTTAEQGVRLDKFLAERQRLGSRRRASVALDRGKVFLNTVEVAPDAASVRLATGDRIRVWMARPGSARRRTPTRSGDLRIVFEDDALIVLDKPAGVLAVPLARRAQAPHGASHRSRYVGTRRVCQAGSGPGIVKGSVQASGGGARLPGCRVRASGSVLRDLAGSTGVGSTRVDPERDAPPRSTREGSRLPVRSARAVQDIVADRSAPAHRQTQPDPPAGEAQRPHARRRTPLRLRTRSAAPDRIRTAGASCVPARVRASRLG